MRKIIVSSTNHRKVPKKFEPEWLANKILLESEFRDGKIAYVRYAGGKLTIIVGKKVRRLE